MGKEKWSPQKWRQRNISQKTKRQKRKIKTGTNEQTLWQAARRMKGIKWHSFDIIQ